jgi:hypothetical protein
MAREVQRSHRMRIFQMRIIHQSLPSLLTISLQGNVRVLRSRRLFDCGYGVGARGEALQVVCNKVKDFIDAEKAVLVNIGSRKSYTWDDMYKIWCNYAEQNEVRKNRVPLTLRRLSGWVHQQRKDYKDELLSEKQIELLQCKGFDFRPQRPIKLLQVQPKILAKNHPKKAINQNFWQVISGGTKNPQCFCNRTPIY